MRRVKNAYIDNHSISNFPEAHLGAPLFLRWR